MRATVNMMNGAAPSGGERDERCRRAGQRLAQ
jgi:hypothetical protein